MNDEHFIKLAASFAEEVEPVAAAKISALVVHRGEIISVGKNVAKSHPFQARYSKNLQAIFWHAETNAVFSALRAGTSDRVLKNATLYIARVKKDHSYGLAKPCNGCRSCLTRFNIGRVVYTNESGFEELYQV